MASGMALSNVINQLCLPVRLPEGNDVTETESKVIWDGALTCDKPTMPLSECIGAARAACNVLPKRGLIIAGSVLYDTCCM